MILLCGIPSEEPIALVRDRLEEIGAPFTLFNQRCFESAEINFEVDVGVVRGVLGLNRRYVRLADISAVYVRFMDDRRLPELSAQPADSPARRYCRAVHETLTRWCEITPARVVNRLRAMASNASKPYQAQLIRSHGFDVPETLITNQPELVREFLDVHKRVIYKSISGVRSIVREFADSDLERLDSIRWCPTQFQEFVAGRNVRVHTIGAECFATVIDTDATDYRYAARQTGEAAALTPYELVPELAHKCLHLSAGLGLDFAGIDLKISPDGRVYCFEVNPCPAYSYYENSTGQPMSLALARLLASTSSPSTTPDSAASAGTTTARVGAAFRPPGVRHEARPAAGSGHAPPAGPRQTGPACKALPSVGWHMAATGESAAAGCEGCLPCA